MSSRPTSSYLRWIGEIIRSDKVRTPMKNAEQFDPTHETWSLAKLKPFFMQNATYAPPSAEEISRLAADIEKNGGYGH